MKPSPNAYWRENSLAGFRSIPTACSYTYSGLILVKHTGKFFNHAPPRKALKMRVASEDPPGYGRFVDSLPCRVKVPSYKQNRLRRSIGFTQRNLIQEAICHHLLGMRDQHPTDKDVCMPLPSPSIALNASVPSSDALTS